MKIAASVVHMNSVSNYTEKSVKKESLKMWVGNERPDFEGRSEASRLKGTSSDILNISDQAKSLKSNKDAKAERAEKSEEDTVLDNEDKRKMYLLEKLFEALTGKKIKFQLPEDFRDCETNQVDLPCLDLNQAPGEKQGWGMEYDFYESHYEKEDMTFGAQGIIKTSDGKEINFSLNLNMSREYFSERNIQFRAGDAKLVDPLVINFDGTAAELTNTEFNFDLDGNGILDKIYFVTGNSGMLALDVNNDGKINNGRELFGPSTGNGFSELAEYDSDKNNWIDENDPIFNRLQIWTKDPQGRDTLYSLKEKGVGAIYLGNVDSPFSFKDKENTLQGQVVRTGIYVKEQNTVGTVHQIDLTI